VMTDQAFAYVTGPEAVSEFTGVPISRSELGGAGVHDVRAGVAAFVVADESAMVEAIATLLSYLPSESIADPPRHDVGDPIDRDCPVAASIVPRSPTAGFDVREVLDDVLDTHSLCEVRARYAPNVLTAFGRLGGRAVGIIANQPGQRAGTLDIEASRKAARHVSWCDAFNLPILTFVDTPGFEPGRDLEWRGMIRHGAELVHAYCEATVPRLCVIMRKSFGGAYIVMDSRGIANDLCVAWPSAEIAVMGAPGAVQILGDKGVTEAAYTDAFLNPYRAAERGFVDLVIDPIDTRRVLGGGLKQFRTKRAIKRSRKHSNSPQ
jgi:acetyl-CoA carboxylase carboxyltransferase component